MNTERIEDSTERVRVYKTVLGYIVEVDGIRKGQPTTAILACYYKQKWVESLAKEAKEKTPATV